MAVASLCVAALGLNVKVNVVDAMRSIMQNLTHHPADSIATCIVQIEELFSSRLASFHQMTLNSFTKRTGSNYASSKTTSGSQDDLCQPETPTDVQDIYF